MERTARPHRIRVVGASESAGRLMVPPPILLTDDPRRNRVMSFLLLVAALCLVAVLIVLLLSSVFAPISSRDLAPNSLTAEMVDGVVTLTWNAPARDAESVTGYEILRRMPASQDAMQILVADTGSTNTTYTDTAANELGALYHYQVVALRGSEKSVRSNSVYIMLPGEARASEQHGTILGDAGSGDQEPGSENVPPANPTVELTDYQAPPGSAECESTSTVRCYAENGTVAVVKARMTDAAGTTLTWSLSGGDSGDFLIDAGVLGFVTPPDYEAPADAGADNRYEVTLQAFDGTNSASLDVTVIVTNVDEEGVVTLSSAQPQVGAALSATLTDPDGGVSGVTWQWASSPDGATGWSTIDGAVADSYTPVAGDAGDYLRVTASYADPQGSGKSAQAISANAVREPREDEGTPRKDEPPPPEEERTPRKDEPPPPEDERTPRKDEPPPPEEDSAPEFPSTETGVRGVAENTPVGTNIGAPVTATPGDSTQTLTYVLGGTDAASFAIVSSSGQLRIKASLDYEAKNSYSVIVVAYYSPSSFDSLNLMIAVTNVDEKGAITFSLAQPQIGAALSATLTDPDGSVSGVTWQWESSPDGATGWKRISGAIAGSYTPVAGDAGNYLRVTASYTDPQGSGKSAQTVSANAVLAPREETRRSGSTPRGSGGGSSSTGGGSSSTGGGSSSTGADRTPDSTSRTGGQCLTISPRPPYCFRVTAYDANPVLYTYEYLEEHRWEIYARDPDNIYFYVREICFYYAAARSYRCGYGTLWFPRQGPFDYYRERPQGTSGTNFAYWASQLATELSNATESTWWIQYDADPMNGRFGQSGEFEPGILHHMRDNLNNDHGSGITYYYMAQRCDRSRGCGEVRSWTPPDAPVTIENLTEALAVLPQAR